MKAVLLVLTLCITTAVSDELCIHGQPRLTGSLSSNEGTVEVCIDGVWKDTCYYSWRTDATRLVCRQLGFPDNPPSAIVAMPRPYLDYDYDDNTGVLFFYCTGAEMSIIDCDYYEEHFRYCGLSTYISCPCHETTIRLTNGLIPQEGQVEVCLDGIWRGVCSNNWDHQDAFVVCRHLGYPVTRISILTYGYFGEHLMPNVTNIQCYGNESHLLDCSYTNTSFCGPRNAAGVRCQGDVLSETPCFEGTVQLSGGMDRSEGRIEVCSNGVWGTICGSIDVANAATVCKQLGYQNPRVYLYSSYESADYFGIGNGPILFNTLNCNGTESTLTKCSSTYNPLYCSHNSDIGVKCDKIAGEAIDACSNGDIRLMGGKTTREGRVEICFNNIWGSVCDDGWDTRDAAVACSQLGFQAVVPAAFLNAHFGMSDGPYYLDYVRCDGYETSLLECSTSTFGEHHCTPGMDVGVSCNASTCFDGYIRLIDGATDYDGRLEVCVNGQWATVRRNGFSSTSASIACQQLRRNSRAEYSGFSRFGEGGNRILLEVDCIGSETRFSDCPRTVITDFDDYYYYYEISLTCYVESGCKDGDVRLMDGGSELEGRVEICWNRVWGAVANSGWTFQEAKIICTQLGYSSEWVVLLTSSFFGRGTAPILTSYVSCFGNEPSIQDCSHNKRSPSSSIYYRNDPVVSVICHEIPTFDMECSFGDVNLFSGKTQSEGRVEICVHGFWTTVCDEGFEVEDALVICREVGFSPKVLPMVGGFFGEGNGPIIGNLSCTSRESNITQCGWEFGRPDCLHSRDVGIRCEDGYNVSLAPATSGPFPIGTNITLLCLVHPEIATTDEIEYQWTTSVSNIQPVSSNSSFPNATFVIPPGHPRHAQYFCHVYRKGYLLGRGNGSIEVQNLLQTVGKQHLQYTPPQPITLNVKVSSHDIQYEFRALTWFHNGVEVISNERRVLSKSNTTLSILNTTEEDSGVYEVKFTGLLVHPYTRKCEQDILALLRHYPVAAAALFHLYTNSPEPNVLDSSEEADEIHFDGPNVVPFATSESVMLTVNGNVHTLIDETVSTSWFFNGGALRVGANVGPLKKPRLSISQTMKIESPNALDSGFYEVALTIDSYTHLISHLQCPTQYNEFVINNVGIDSIVLARDTIQLVQSESVANASSNSSSIAGGTVGGIIALIVLSVGAITVCLMWKKRKSINTAGNTATEPTAEKSPERVCYTSTTENVQVGPNVSYEQADFPDYPGEIIYDKVN